MENLAQCMIIAMHVPKKMVLDSLFWLVLQDAN